MNSTPEEQFDWWFEDTHGGTGELEFENDIDECVEDLTFDDLDLY